MRRWKTEVGEKKRAGRGLEERWFQESGGDPDGEGAPPWTFEDGGSCSEEEEEEWWEEGNSHWTTPATNPHHQNQSTLKTLASHRGRVVKCLQMRIII